MKRKSLYCFSCLVVAGLVALSGQAWAINFVTGQSSNANVTINSAADWVIIRQATVNVPANDGNVHGCVATASADVDQSGAAGLESQYRFVLTRNDTSPPTNLGSERLLELVDNSGANDPNSKPVATTQHFNGITRNNGVNGTGTHTFYFLGRKVAAADANTDVLDASLSVVCVHAN